MVDDTKQELIKGTNIICEASFCYDNCFCAVDILKNDMDGVEIYEVKSSTKSSDIYIHDLSYQTWILEKCGFHVKKSSLIYVNDNYIKNGYSSEEIVNVIKEHIKKTGGEPTNGGFWGKIFDGFGR